MAYTYSDMLNYFDFNNTTYKDFLIKYTSVDVYDETIAEVAKQAASLNSYTISFWMELFANNLDVFQEIKGFREIENWEAFNSSCRIVGDDVVVDIPFEPKRCITVSVGSAFYGSMKACLARDIRPITHNIDVNGFERDIDALVKKSKDGEYSVFLDIDMCTASITTAIIGENNEQAYVSRKTLKNLIPSHKIINDKVARTSAEQREILIQDIVNNKISFQ